MPFGVCGHNQITQVSLSFCLGGIELIVGKDLDKELGVRKTLERDLDRAVIVRGQCQLGVVLPVVRALVGIRWYRIGWKVVCRFFVKAQIDRAAAEPAHQTPRQAVKSHLYCHHLRL